MDRIALFLIVLVIALHPRAGHAIGDSGGCGSSWGQIHEVLAHGDAQGLELALQKSQRRQGILSNFLSRSIHLVAFDGCGSPMSAKDLLAVAVTHGNVHTTRYLLDKGAQPDLRLFQTCPQPSKPSQAIAEWRKETFRLALLRSSKSQVPQILQCSDVDILRVYFLAGIKADADEFERRLYYQLTSTQTSPGEVNTKEIERVKTFLIDGGLLQDERGLLALLSHCAAPTSAKAPSCRALAEAANLDYAMLTMTDSRAIDRLLITCSAPYPWLLFPDDGSEDCSAVQRIAPLQFDVFRSALQHAEARRFDQYERLMRDLWARMNIDPKYTQYKLAVLFHLARSAGLTCRSDAEELLKQALVYQTGYRNAEYGIEIDKRVFELAYYYFDRQQYQDARPLFERFIRSHSAHFPGVAGYAQLHSDLGQTYKALGEPKLAADSKRDSDEIGSRVRQWDKRFERMPYPMRCPSTATAAKG
jgi:tetratricopeptide (TPR) repeat protein